MLKLVNVNAFITRLEHYAFSRGRAELLCARDIAEETPTVDAIPVEWLEKKRSAMYPGSEKELIVRRLIDDWREENANFKVG